MKRANTVEAAALTSHCRKWRRPLVLARTGERGRSKREGAKPRRNGIVDYGFGQSSRVARRGDTGRGEDGQESCGNAAGDEGFRWSSSLALNAEMQGKMGTKGTSGEIRRTERNGIIYIGAENEKNFSWRVI